MTVKERCIPNPVFNSWLYILAKSCGYSLESYEGWDPTAGIWLATSDIYSRLANTDSSGAKYCLSDILNRISPAALAAQDCRGQFRHQQLYFPIFIPPATPDGVGHWCFICVKPNEQILEVCYGFGGDRFFEAAIVAKLWDDICTLAMGYNNNAQS
jgi:hypothetical protein